MKHLLFWRALLLAGALLLPLGCVTEELPAKPVGGGSWGKSVIVKNSSLSAKPSLMSKIKGVFKPGKAKPAKKTTPPQKSLAPTPEQLPIWQGAPAQGQPAHAVDPAQLQNMLNGSGPVSAPQPQPAMQQPGVRQLPPEPPVQGSPQVQDITPPQPVQAPVQSQPIEVRPQQPAAAAQPGEAQAPAPDQAPSAAPQQVFQMRTRRAQPQQDDPPVNVPWR